MKSTASLAAVVGTVIVALTACGSTPSQSTESSPGSAVAVPTSSTSAAAGTIVEVTIAEGGVTPVNAQVDAVAGQPIVLEVSSDAADSIHVHSVPERSFDVEARPNQRFLFTVSVPGRVDVELHELHRTIVTIQVRP